MGDPHGGLNQGSLVGYRLLVTLTGDRRYHAEACAERREPLLLLLRQFEELGYEFVRLESIYGG